MSPTGRLINIELLVQVTHLLVVGVDADVGQVGSEAGEAALAVGAAAQGLGAGVHVVELSQSVLEGSPVNLHKHSHNWLFSAWSGSSSPDDNVGPGRRNTPLC